MLAKLDGERTGCGIGLAMFVDVGASKDLTGELASIRLALRQVMRAIEPAPHHH